MADDDWASSVVFSPDGKSLASGSASGEIILWDLETGSQIKSMQGHSQMIWRSLDYSPDGSRLISGCRDDTLIVWDLENGSQFQN